jgi:hypothetical protein
MSSSPYTPRTLGFGIVGIALASCAATCGPSDPGKYGTLDRGQLSVKVVQNVNESDMIKYARVTVGTPVGGGFDESYLPKILQLIPSPSCSGPSCVSDTTEPFSVDSDKPVTVLLEGVRSAGVDGVQPAGEPVLIRRTARGRVPRGTSTIVLDLDDACLVAKGAPTCNTGTTCKGGQCGNDAFGLDDLLFPPEKYPSVPTANCVVNGAPAVFVGTGENAFETIAPGSALPVYSGGQGGQHVLISVQTANMVAKGLTFIFSGKQVGTDVELPYASVPAPLVVKGARCEATGFRYEITGKYSALLNKPADITVTAREASGKRVSQTIRVIVGN